MKSNFEKYKLELDALIRDGDMLYLALIKECVPNQFDGAYKEKLVDAQYEKLLKKIPRFASAFQTWYSEAHSVIKQLIPDRLPDFVKLYEKPKTRKELTASSYVIEDYLQNITVSRGGYVIVSLSTVIPLFEQQLEILKAALGRFESSLFDIKQLVHADLLDSELDAARILQKNKFYRAAGAITGVVIEKHLTQVCMNHNLQATKKNPTISDLNDWRFQAPSANNAA